MSSYYVRAEAVNLDDSIWDTEQVSVMRGGSSIMWNAVLELEHRLREQGQDVDIIQSGGSIALAAFDADGESEAETIRELVQSILADSVSGVGTFVVDVAPATGDFATDMQVLTARNRWRQYQQPALAVPSMDQSAARVCAVDGVRPAARDMIVGNQRMPVSVSVSERLEKGRKLRQNIWRWMTEDELASSVEFVDNLVELAEASGESLCGKMAVIVFDGNHFRVARRKAAVDPDGLKRFDATVRTVAATYLSRVVEIARDAPRLQNAGCLRVELLMSGGDEFEIVVPAWFGWEACRLFYTLLRDPSHPCAREIEEYALSYAAGVVFCHHNAPLRPVRRVCADLLSAAKAATRAGDSLRYLVLESQDQMGASLTDFCDVYYGHAWPPPKGSLWPSLEPLQIERLARLVSEARAAGLAKGRALTVARLLRDGSDNDTLERLRERARSLVGPGAKAALDEFLAASPGLEWFHLVDLWDYAAAWGGRDPEGGDSL